MSELPSRPVETPGEWLRFADENLQVAEREMQAQIPAFHTVCFLCHSAAEKFLKGYLIAQGWTLEKTHDIVALLSIGASYHTEWETLASAGAILNEFLISGRYPDDHHKSIGSLGVAVIPPTYGGGFAPISEFRQNMQKPSRRFPESQSIQADSAGAPHRHLALQPDRSHVYRYGVMWITEKRLT